MNLDHILRSIVVVQTIIPDHGFTAKGLGNERMGSGVVIDETGLVLTIGYLITEASEVSLTTADGRSIPAHPLAYDQETGFGIVQALGRLDLPALVLGSSGEAMIGDPVVLAAGGNSEPVHARIVAKQEFAGYWEYLLDEALFTAPAHPFWGGAALIDQDGKLLGIGSLRVEGANSDGSADAMNMVVPIDLLPPIMEDLLKHGRVNKQPRPWLGAFFAEYNGKVATISLSERGPAVEAGLMPGDIVSSIRETSVEGLADFYRKLWESGPAGTEIPIEIIRDGRSRWLRIKSADRASFLAKPQYH